VSFFYCPKIRPGLDFNSPLLSTCGKEGVFPLVIHKMLMIRTAKLTYVVDNFRGPSWKNSPEMEEILWLE
jgi:hypothetical protein